jgi:glycerol uptake facilitator-like aquaporin
MSTLLRQETKENIKNTFKESFLILVYECVGTAMLTTLIANYYTIKTMKKELSSAADSSGLTIQVDNVGLLLGMFVTIMFSARISGSHFNPCITLAYMLGNVKQGRFDRILGFLYIAAQFAGALLGCSFAKFFSAGVSKVNLAIASNDIMQTVILEILGSFFLVFMYLTSTEEKTKFTKDAAVQTIILAGSYLGAMLIAGVKLDVLDASPVNPAIAIIFVFFNPTAEAFGSMLIFGTMSLVGSVLALIFFRFVYKKT